MQRPTKHELREVQVVQKQLGFHLSVGTIHFVLCIVIIIRYMYIL